MIYFKFNLDECSQLSTQLIVPDVGLSFPPRGLASPGLFNQFPLEVINCIVTLNFILYFY